MTVANALCYVYTCDLMHTNFDKSKYGKEELALLAIFALGLLLSYILVVNRSQIKLSAPISLHGSGLSIRIPAGNSWQSSNQWQLNSNENSLDLSSTLQIGNQVEGRFICRYAMALEKIPAQERLRQDFGGDQGMVSAEGVISLDEIDIFWYQISMDGGMADTFVAEGDLPNGRALKMFFYAAADVETAEILLQSVCKSLELEPNDLLEKGKEFVDHLKDIGVSDLTAGGKGEGNSWGYLLNNTDENGDYAGFAIDTFEPGGVQYEWGDVRGESFYHSKSPNGLNSNSIYAIDDRFDRMVWQTKLSGRRGRNEETIEIELAGDGVMRVTRLRPAKEDVYWPGGAAIPKILIDSAVRAFIDYGEGDVLLDVISARGTIVPTLLKRLEAVDFPEIEGVEVSYCVSMDFVQRKQYILFDADKNIVGKVDDVDGGGLVWQRSDLETLLTVEKHQQWREYINRLLNRLQNR